MRKIWKNVCIILLVMGVFFAAPMAAAAADEDIAGGIVYEDYGQIIWRIDKDGHLIAEGWGDLSKNSKDEEERIPWYPYRDKILSAEIHIEKMRNASYLFYDCLNMTRVDLDGFQTNETTDMKYMFSGCKKLKELDISHLDSSHVTDMSFMFQKCEQLGNIDVSRLDTHCVITMEGMFAYCSKLKKLDLTTFDTRRVTNMAGMFADCYALTEVDIGKWNTQYVTTINSMFRSCHSLEQLDLSGLEFKSANNLGYVFFGCKSLESLDVSNFNISKAWNVTSMFEGCEGLQYLDLSTFDFSGGGYSEYFLYECANLTKIETPINISDTIDLPSAPSGEAWYSPDGELRYSFESIGNRSVTLRRLKKDGFWDVYPEEWYVSYIEYVFEEKLMTGNGKLFKPDNPMTRAMVVQTLYNMEGKPTVTEYRACIDLKDVYVDWYTDAVCWAYNEGITTGYDDTKTFEVNKSVTREELAAFLYRYANYKGYDTIQEGDFSGIENVNLVSPYAKNAMSWAVGAGLISGIEIKQYGAIVSRDLAPQGTATRAQMAAILQRFCIAYAEPVILEWNGHSYAVFDNCQTWEGAKAFCEAKGGHLAVIESAEENEALYNFIKENGYTSAYFGLSDTANEGNWSWVNGEATDYTNWNAEEPGGGTDENYAMFFYLYEDGTWNDGAFKENVYDGGNAYICEWGNP